MNYDRIGLSPKNLAPRHENDIKIRQLYDEFAHEYHTCLNDFQFKQATLELRKFFKDTFCDWYIEDAKTRLREDDKHTLATLMFILDRILMHFHPFIPFITEKIWGSYHETQLISAHFSIL